MGHNEDKPTRIYHFELPYTVSAMYVHFGLNKLKDEGLFDRLPKDLQVQFEAAAAAWEPVVIIKEECDEIDENTWEIIAAELGLAWSKA